MVYDYSGHGYRISLFGRHIICEDVSWELFAMANKTFRFQVVVTVACTGRVTFKGLHLQFLVLTWRCRCLLSYEWSFYSVWDVMLLSLFLPKCVVLSH